DFGDFFVAGIGGGLPELDRCRGRPSVAGGGFGFRGGGGSGLLDDFGVAALARRADGLCADDLRKLLDRPERNPVTRRKPQRRHSGASTDPPVACVPIPAIPAGMDGSGSAAAWESHPISACNARLHALRESPEGSAQILPPAGSRRPPGSRRATKTPAYTREP